MHKIFPLVFFLSRDGLILFSTLPSQVKELCALGFSDEARCHEVLRQSGGDVRGALVLLQRPLLEPFHKRIWSDKPEPPVDIHHPDKQVRPGISIRPGYSHCKGSVLSHLNSVISLVFRNSLTLFSF